ncbi:MAM domain-containing glycosylphosphatidylinositol anchor protein 2 [Peromyscus eremicus]|uniref:MAM domain-containing glycosylphosphatidylinositol anchor protein 2 n=1 Tax=Peromyscus eremicus TaxID=42410 RepID=UPI0027DC682A|nr:MAM domain-containing glycosylphosphatidylinositol anchor protein 2 [Peromyscus eremicus]
MSVGCVGLQRSALGRRQGRTDGRRFLPSGAVPGHLDSARAQVERAWLAAGLRKVPLRPPWAGYVHVHVKMDLVYGLVWLLTVLLEGISGQGVYAPPTVRIVHSGLACNIEEERYSERVYTIREGETLELTCLVTGHPRPQIRWTKTAGSASDRFQDSSVFNETLRITNIQRHQGGRYYCKAENGLGSPAIKSIRVDVYYLDDPVVTVHQSIGEAKEQFYYERTVFLRCVANSNPPVRYSWRRGQEVLLQGSDKGVEIYEPFFTQLERSYKLTDNYLKQNVPTPFKPRKEQITDDPPAVEPAFLEIRQGQDRSVTMSCRVLRAYPIRVLTYEWRLGNKLLRTGQFDSQEYTEYPVKSLSNENYGVYNCSIINEAGAGRCSFLVTGKAYAPEFYYDTYNPVWQNRHRVYSYSLQWTQMNPDAVDRIVAYRLGIRQAGQQRWWEQEIKINGNIQKGELITYNLTELIKPEAYEVRLTPLTKFGEGDSTIRVIKYTAPVNPHLREFHCGFEDGNICLFTQDDTDNFDWTKQSTATRNTKYTPNTGPNADRSGSKEGFYMYIETSRPRLEGEKARLLSPVFSIAPKNPYGPTNTAYCFSFFYHMYGQHIGVLNVYLRLKGQTTIENPLWSSSGNKGQRWNEAHVNIYPITSFQLIFEGIRGPGIEGDIAIDDVSIAEGECAKQDLTTKNSVDGAVGILVHLWLFPVIILISILSPRR